MARKLSMPKETTETTGGMKDYVKREHPAFGQIQVSRVSGGQSQLYGSPIKHSNTIRLSVHPSYEMVSNYAHHHHNNLAPLIEVEMSEAQWATMVSSLNMGSGTPCTIRYTRDGKLVEVDGIADDTDLEKQTKKIADIVQKDIEGLSACYADLQRLMKEPSIKKAALGEIISKMMHHVEYAPGKYQFAGDCLTEHVEAVRTAAMAEVHAHVTGLAFKFPELAKLDDAMKETLSIEDKSNG